MIASTLSNLHVYASRNCMWDPLDRAHRILKPFVAAHNVTIPAMHYVEIPGSHAPVRSPRRRDGARKSVATALRPLSSNTSE